MKNVVSAHRYKVFAPDSELLTLIVNGTVRQDARALGGYELSLSRVEPLQIAQDYPIKWIVGPTRSRT